MPKQNNFFTENKYATLYVKNFGKIKEAEIELAPFTVFIGDNNSGKSYLLNLIWGLQDAISNDTNLFSISNNEHIEKETAYINIATKLDSIIDFSVIKDKKTIILDETDINNIMILINKMLYENKGNFIKGLFNSDDVSAAEVTLYIPKNTPIEFTIQKYKHRDAFVSIYDTGNDAIEYEIEFHDDEKPLKDIINFIAYGFQYTLFPSTRPDFYTPVFFPTSRTGFLLTNRELAKKAVSDKYQIRTLSPDTNNTKFLDSTVSFINMLLSFDSKHDTKQVKEIIEYIEKEVIHGKLFLHPETMEFLYTPEGTKLQLKMHTTSAVVTELAPLILYLKYHALTDALFMEEPEISLHPELQQKIIRVFIKLLNMFNQQVFISTHSDTIIQHINNMIKLSNNPSEMQEKLFTQLGYDKNDVIHQDKIRMYQFDVEPSTQKTHVINLESSEYGFEAKTFNTTLEAITKEIYALQENVVIKGNEE